MTSRPKCVLVGLAAREAFAASPALTYAIALARHHGACLTVCVLPPAFYVPVTRTGGSASAILRSEIERLEETTRQTARSAAELVGKAGVSCIAEHTLSPLEPRTDRLVRLARVNDVAILDAAEAGNDLQKTAIEDVLFDSGRPVLIVPPVGGNAIPRRLAIAWDGSARSARSVADAMPFLQDAETAFVVTVTDEKDLSRMAPGADLATHLLQHGVGEPRLETLAAINGDAAARLRKFVKDESIEMLVMGAFVHSRFRQAILGGVTRSLLDDVPVPLFMAH
ncbi:universal stress protein [Chelativorans alearense]|uniref:universal stress protein n=1 Tax=Chelativorans alearense TaxID=2681495 RepID=UPI0013D7C14C|nr:universal stress protein [Chelativorans alearense]